MNNQYPTNANIRTSLPECNVCIVNKSKHPLPEYGTPQSSGCDLRANINEDIVLEPMQRKMIPTGLYIQLPPVFEAQVRPRSGLALKHGITVLNTPGTIDSDYRGEICVILINLGDTTFVVHDGDRIAQLVIAPFIQAVWDCKESLSETERGEGGFGHTGV